MNDGTGRDAIELAWLKERWIRWVQHAEQGLQSSRGERARLLFHSWQLEKLIGQVRQVASHLEPGLARYIIGEVKPLAERIDFAVQQCGPSAVSGWLKPMTLQPSGPRGGRPRIEIDPSFLRQAVDDLHLNSVQIGGLLFPDSEKKVSARTVRKHILLHGLREPNEPTRRFANIAEEDLLALMEYIITELQPNVGAVYMEGALLHLGFRIQRDRVRALLSGLVPIRTAIRQETVAVPRVYSNDGPNHVWHLDGQHELVAFGIVVHGITDGYSRAVVGLRANSNNRPDTMLDVFRQATVLAGVPDRVRGDRGGENIEVAVVITCVRGLDRSSFIWGTSPHNTRIERLWPEVVRLVLGRWYGFFHALTSDHGYTHGDESHKWLGIYLFLGDINGELRFFQGQHNRHRLSSARGWRVDQLFFSGQVHHGVRGMWEGDYLVSRDDAEAEVVEGWNAGEMRGHVELEDPRCPFEDRPVGIARMEVLMRNRWGGSRFDRWAAGMECMFTVLGEEM